MLMNYAFITGASSGIGKETALLLLNQGWTIYGLSRSRSITHQAYRHIEINLAELNAMNAFRFPAVEDAGHIVLINNAGRLGKVAGFGFADAGDLDESIRLNLLAPMVLMNQFVASFEKKQVEKLIINISSGAGSFPIDGWPGYCASKAGLDMATRVLQTEIKIKKISQLRALYVAPGIVDTPMQRLIRQSGETSFSRQGQFVDMHKKGTLIPPEKVAIKITELISNYRSLPDDKIEFKYE